MFLWRRLLQSLRAKTVGGEGAQAGDGGVARVSGKVKFQLFQVPAMVRVRQEEAMPVGFQGELGWKRGCRG